MLTIAVNFVIAISLIICIILLGLAFVYSLEDINPHSMSKAIWLWLRPSLSLMGFLALISVFIVFLTSL